MGAENARLLQAALLTGAIVAAGCAPAPRLVGDPLPSPLAPNFALIDGPTGETIVLSSLRGRVVLLTFLYTSCPDTCPLTAETLRNAHDLLGPAATQVAFVAVSLDPARDTPSAARRFVEEHRLQGVLRYLIGSRSELTKVWAEYGVAQAPLDQFVAHTDVIYLIDRNERGRVVLHSDVPSDVLASDLRILLQER